MTILDTTNRRFYTGNGTATTYAINSLSGDALTGITIFKITDIKVYLDGVLQTYTTDYTITSDTPSPAFAGKLVNASVVFVTAPVASVEIAIVREIPYTQELGLSNGNNVPPKPLESQLDKLAVQTQQLNESFSGRVLRVEAFESTVLDPITVENGSYLKWEAGQLINATPIAVGVDISNSTVTQVATNTSNIATNTADIDALELVKNPSTAGNALEVVRVNAGATAYEVVPFNDLLPSQTGNANKVLTTNGTNASWANVPFATVNYDGTTAANLTGTFTRTGSTVTVNVTGHGHIVGHRVYFVGAGVTSGWYTVATVANANTFTFDSGTSGAIGSTACTLPRRSIRSQVNVQSIPYQTTGYTAINFSSAYANANYVLLGSAQNRSGTESLAVVQFHCSTGPTFFPPTTLYSHIDIRNTSTAGLQDMTDVSIAIF